MDEKSVAATEDRNTGPGTDRIAVDMWRSPFGATEDRNHGTSYHW